jgi:glycosyltransferase involved in cell wall biosynthesis
MRIVYVSWEYPPQFGGGIGTYVHGAATTLAARGHDVTVVTVCGDGVPARERVDRVTIIRLPAPGGTDTRGPAGTMRSWQARADSVAALLERLIAVQAIDLIEFADYRGEGFTFLTATEPSKRPVSVVRLHTALHVLYKYNSGHVRYPVLEQFEGQAILAADRVGSPSHVLANEMREALPAMREVEITPYPCDPTFLNYQTDSVAPRNEALYVGRFEQRKGVETLIRAAGRFLDACPEIELTLIGGDTAKSASEPSVRKLVRDAVPARHADRINLLDPIPRERLLDRYTAARFCVFPSLFENFPNTCLESMSLGNCVIGTDNSGMAEMIQHGVNGLISRAGDPEDLADKLIELATMSDEQRARMGAAARQRMRDRYRPEVIGAEMEELYTRYITRHNGESCKPLAPLGDSPRVAVVIPCFNQGRFLPETLASVAQQTYPHVECVVVDDGSTDAHTKKVLDAIGEQGTRVIRQENQGLSAARNAGVRATDAQFFVPLDADDMILPAFIEKLLPTLRDDPTLGYSYCHVEFFGTAEGVWECPAYEPARLLLENQSVATAVVRRAAYEIVGGYQTDMVHGFEDWDLWLAMLSVGYRGRCTPEPLCRFRKQTDGSMLTTTQQHRGDMMYRIVEHHRLLFAALMEQTLVRKDELFFRAHMQAWRAKQSGDPIVTLIDQLAKERDDALTEAQRLGRGWESQRAHINHLEGELKRARTDVDELRRGGTLPLTRRWPLAPILAKLRRGPSSGDSP